MLHRLYLGVFAWGHHNIPTEGRFLAAVKAWRQAALEAAGERVLRFTKADLRNPRQIAARLRAAGVRDA